MTVNQIPRSAEAQAKTAKAPHSSPDNPLFQALLEQCGEPVAPKKENLETSLPGSYWEMYQTWKTAQAPQQLPASKGRTAENTAYLENRYSGRLSAFRQLEAWDTLRDMEIITQEQYEQGLAFRFPQEDLGSFYTAGALNESEDGLDSFEDFFSRVFLPGWLERLEEMDRTQEEEQTLKILLDYVDALVEQAKEENRLKLREEQLQFWLSRAR